MLDNYCLKSGFSNDLPEQSDGYALASCVEQCSMIVVYSQSERAVCRNPTVTCISLGQRSTSGLFRLRNEVDLRWIFRSAPRSALPHARGACPIRREAQCMKRKLGMPVGHPFRSPTFGNVNQS